MLSGEQPKPGRVFFKELTGVQLILPDEGGTLVVRVWRHDKDEGPEEIRVRPDDEVESIWLPARASGGPAPEEEGGTSDDDVPCPTAEARALSRGETRACG